MLVIYDRLARQGCQNCEAMGLPGILQGFWFSLFGVIEFAVL